MAKIRKRKWINGTGEQSTRFTVDFTDANGKRQRKQFTSRKEADAFRIEIEGQIKSGSFRAESGKVTVKQAADLFVAYCKGRMTRHERMTRHCYAMYEGHVHNYICPDAARHQKKIPHKSWKRFEQGIGEVKLANLTARSVVDFRDRLRDAGISVPTCRKILATLQLILNHAIGRDLIAVNAAKGVTVIGRRDEGSKKIVPPTKDGMRRLIEVADVDFRVKLLVACATGVRAGEMHALRWRHIDFEEGAVTIETRVDAYGKEDVTKTAAGMRTVPLAGSLITELKAWKLRSKRKQADDLVFPNKRGWYVCHPNMIKRKFLPLFDKLDALHKEDPDTHSPSPPRFNWHALRHFAVSCWIDAGLKPKTIQTFAGHSTLQVTMDRYGHLFKSDDHRKAMDAIAKSMF